jgi:hypothetical protein
MIIISDQVGQLCNRLWAYAPFIAAAIHHRKIIYLPGLAPYAALFPNLACHPLIRLNLFSHPKLQYWSDRLLDQGIILAERKKISRFVQALICTDASDLLQQNLRRRHHAIRSWTAKKPNSLLTLHKEEVLAIFQLRGHEAAQTNRAVANNKIAIGVHVRGGDYRKWMGGKYYFDADFYIRALNDLAQEVVTRGGTPVFYIASNENISAIVESVDGCLNTTGANVDEDLLRLSACDFILGPPSTFSMWASFYGETPLRFVYDKDQKMDLNDFKIIISQDTFEDGTGIWP